MRLIDADAFKIYLRGALDEVKHLYEDGGEWAEEITESFCRDIDEQPTIEERKKGKWTMLPNGNALCSECGYMQVHVWDLEGWDNYCHHCGADMREEITNDLFEY